MDNIALAAKCTRIAKQIGEIAQKDEQALVLANCLYHESDLTGGICGEMLEAMGDAATTVWREHFQAKQKAAVKAAGTSTI